MLTVGAVVGPRGGGHGGGELRRAVDLDGRRSARRCTGSPRARSVSVVVVPLVVTEPVTLSLPQKATNLAAAGGESVPTMPPKSDGDRHRLDLDQRVAGADGDARWPRTGQAARRLPRQEGYETRSALERHAAARRTLSRLWPAGSPRAARSSGSVSGGFLRRGRVRAVSPDLWPDPNPTCTKTEVPKWTKLSFATDGWAPDATPRFPLPSPRSSATSPLPRRTSPRCPRPSTRSRTAAIGRSGRRRRTATPPPRGA